MTAPTILIAGLGRCGTSLVMQMLHAAGVPTIGTYPAFEDQDEVELRKDPAAWHKLTAGKAVKILNPHKEPPPAAHDYRAIFLSRSFKEQAKSTLKFTGEAESRSSRRCLEAQLRIEDRLARKAMCTLDRGIYLNIPFENLISRTGPTTSDIASYLSMRRRPPLDAKVMARCVHPRSPECLPYLLEDELVAQDLILPTIEIYPEK